MLYRIELKMNLKTGLFLLIGQGYMAAEKLSGVCIVMNLNSFNFFAGQRSPNLDVPCWGCKNGQSEVF